ncbi:hypothetical protein [Paenibacillus sp. XY044]|uniref:AlkZ-related protein n=1 Tax=Paenibacillus sp. XY044 TaxID=2026089 RepID=UPI00211B4C27|nr:hypothetical protein [Paenibacillus sp. XY044]
MLKENEENSLQIERYEDACGLIARVGILPLAGLIPGHPSLDGVTPKEHWHTGTERDPWLWRARFPGDGTAAYGKFIKKKAVLISADWFPMVQRLLGFDEEPEERYRDGLLSKPAWELYQLIRDDEGIETRELRARADMKSPDRKKEFDQALAELQGQLAIVISGVKEKRNILGEKNGWSSTSYQATEDWMRQYGVESFRGTREQAQTDLKLNMEDVCTPEAAAFLQKVFGIR